MTCFIFCCRRCRLYHTLEKRLGSLGDFKTRFGGGRGRRLLAAFVVLGPLPARHGKEQVVGLWRMAGYARPGSVLWYRPPTPCGLSWERRFFLVCVRGRVHLCTDRGCTQCDWTSSHFWRTTAIHWGARVRCFKGRKRLLSLILF